ncbi:MAG TPA: methionyl-tRNA formyltransferase [Chloroflexota bacterium]|nr:methionyl-tRNA formyltransferase [Chloroflexota bacterium]
MRIVFMGTPDFAVAPLRALIAAGFELAAVVTAPDRPAGRGRRVQAPPVKEAALEAGIPVFQPATLRTPEAEALLRSMQPEVIVVVAFGQILRRNILDLPPLGCLNLHPSLLPYLRGAAPIPAAIREGLTETGVTVMLMNERMDAGPILAQARVPIFPDDTAATLGDRLSRLGAELLVETLPRWKAGVIVPREQDESAATYCRPLTKADGFVDWSWPADLIARTCRAYTPWPGCLTYWGDRLVRLLRVRADPSWNDGGPPGTVVTRESAPGQRTLGITTGQGVLVVEALQLAGKKPLAADEFLRGQPGFVGSRLSRELPSQGDAASAAL